LNRNRSQNFSGCQQVPPFAIHAHQVVAVAFLGAEAAGSPVRPVCTPGASPPSPPPGVFSEVLILKGFETNVSEVLIIQGLLSRLVILIDLKSLIISDLIKNEDFAKVLILEELQRDFSEVLNLEDLNGAKRANGWI